MNNVDKQINRMKAMMNYGIQSEGTNHPYKSVERQMVAADGKTYGIVREGTKFYIKVANKTTDVLKEDFNYIGGFRNRASSEYDSFAKASKDFDIRLRDIRENEEKKGTIIEAWDHSKNIPLTSESTDKIKNEIARQKAIMANASMLAEGKTINECGCVGQPFCDQLSNEDVFDMEGGVKGSQKKNGTYMAKPVVGKGVKKENKNKKGSKINESDEVLGWNDDEQYLDTSHGTEIGDGAPFDQPKGSKAEMENGVVEAIVKDGQRNQNEPTVGVGEIGDGQPFEDAVNEGVEEDGEDIEDAPVEDAADVDVEDEIPSNDEEDFTDEDPAMDDIEGEDIEDLGDDVPEMDDEDEFDGDVEERLSAIEDLLQKVCEKIGVSDFGDDELYDDDDNEDVDVDLDMDDNADFGEEDSNMGDEDLDVDDYEAEEGEEDDDFNVIESKSYRRYKRMNEEAQRMDYFGKHPAYQKAPMSTPANNNIFKNGNYDMNDESVYNNKPFGTKIGNGAPFEITIEQIENAITESINRILKKKK